MEKFLETLLLEDYFCGNKMVFLFIVCN